MIESIFKTIAPDRCNVCNAVGSTLCLRCFNNYNQFPPSTCFRCNKLTKDFRTCPSCRSSTAIFSAHKLNLYSNPIRQLILKAKFGNSRDSAKLIGSLMAGTFDLPSDIDLVTFVPTSSQHVRRRGFDHALLIAGKVAEKLDTKLVKSLYRQKNIQQIGASRFIRKRQTHGLFRVATPNVVCGAKILLIDDVISTGATIEEAAMTLKQAGAKRIYVAVAAHNR